MKIKSKYLVETEWLAQNLDDPNLVIIEANVGMPNYYKDSAANTIELVSGREDYRHGHIPNADFVDLVTELSDRTDDSQMFALPSKEQFIDTMSRHGIGEDAKVIIYDRSSNLWACRFWLMIQSYGFDNVAVLNGGWRKWTSEERPVSKSTPTVTPKKFVVKRAQNLFTTKPDVIEAMENDNICLINALGPEEFAGHGVVRYSRPGHIPSSKNVPFMFLIDPKTSEFLEREVIEAMFRKAGAFEKDRVVSYCGGAVGACSGVFLMTVLGIKNVALYNGSLKEWSADSALPMVTLDKVEEWSVLSV